MSKFMGWAGSQLEKLDTIASKALSIKEEAKDEEIRNLEFEVSDLKEKIQILQSNKALELKNLKEDYQTQIKTLKDEKSNFEFTIKNLSEENALLSESLKNAENKLDRASKLNEELTENFEKEMESIENVDSIDEYQLALLTEKIKRQSAVLKAEKLKVVDLTREKSELLESCQAEKKNLELKIEDLENSLKNEKETNQELKDQLETRPKQSLNMENNNLTALSEHLQAKQKIIETLINEKSNLVLMLENEVKSK